MFNVIATIINLVLWLIYIFTYLVPYGKVLLNLGISHNWSGMLTPALYLLVATIVCSLITKAVSAIGSALS